MTKRNRELEEQLERLEAAVDPAKVGRVKDLEARAVSLKESTRWANERTKELEALARIQEKQLEKGERLLAALWADLEARGQPN